MKAPYDVSVDVLGHDPSEPWVDCPFRNTEYGTCQLYHFKNPDRKTIKCTESIEVENDDFGLYLYQIPEKCPLRSGPATVRSV